jgi:hypothetical protein
VIEECTNEEQRSTVRVLCSKGHNENDIHKEMLPTFFPELPTFP